MSNSQPPTQRDTDPSELNPTSLPPNSYTYADVIATHHAVLDELKGLRLDNAEIKSDLADLRLAIASLREAIIEAPSWVSAFYDTAEGVVACITKLESQAEHGFLVCRYHHSNGGSGVANGIK